MRDLTLRSAASFGSFHLIRLLYDEYIFYLIEQRVAKTTRRTPLQMLGEVSIHLHIHPHTCHHSKLYFLLLPILQSRSLKLASIMETQASVSNATSAVNSNTMNESIVPSLNWCLHVFSTTSTDSLLCLSTPFPSSPALPCLIFHWTCLHSTSAHVSCEAVRSRTSHAFLNCSSHSSLPSITLTLSL